MRIVSCSLAVLALATAPAVASEWRAFEGNAKNIYFFDTESVIDDGPEWRRFWIEVVHARPGSDRIKSVKSQWRVNCAKRVIGLTATVGQNSAGEGVQTTVVEPPKIKEMPIVPDTVSDRAGKIACDSIEGRSAASIRVHKANAVTADAFFRLLKAGIDPVAAIMLASVPPEVAEEVLSSEAGREQFSDHEKVIRATLGLGTPL